MPQRIDGGLGRYFPHKGGAYLFPLEQNGPQGEKQGGHKDNEELG